MGSMSSTNTVDGLEAEIRADLDAQRSLGQIVAAAASVRAAQRRGAGKQGPFVVSSVRARFSNLLLRRGLLPGQFSVARPELAWTPLLGEMTVIEELGDGTLVPVNVAFDSAADVVDDGDVAGEADLVFTIGDRIRLPTISHEIPVTTQSLKYSTMLEADIDTYLSGGVLVRLEDAVAAALAGASGLVEHDFDTDVVTTVRTAIAAAQSAFRELGPGEIVVLMSPIDHAALDLDAIGDVSGWPARIVSSPSITAGTAFASRFKLSTRLYASPVEVTFGHIDKQFIRNRITAMATMEGYAHIAAPTAIVKADLTAGNDDVS